MSAGNSVDVGMYQALEQILDEEFSSSSDLRKLFQRRRSVSFTTSVQPENLDKVKKKDVGTIRGEVALESSRPSSMLIHDNDDLIKLANNLQGKSIGQRRGSSSIVFQKDYPMSPSMARRSVSVRNEIRRPTNDSAGGKKVPDNLPKAKPTSVSLGKSSGGKLSSFGHLFGGSTKKTASSGIGYSSSSAGVQSKIAKKVDRQISKESTTTTASLLEERRSQFTQARSSTGLNFFSNRRRSVAVTDELPSVKLRTARSHLNLLGLEADQEKEVEEMYHTPETAVKPNFPSPRLLSKEYICPKGSN